MTVSSTARAAGPFLGNGVTTSFPFSFKVFDKAGLDVTLTDSTGARTALVLDSVYSVTLNADQNAAPGGTITYPIAGSALATGASLTIVGDTAAKQPLDLVNLGRFLPEAVEAQLDRLTMLVQESGARSSRALRFAPTDAVSADMPLLSFLKGHFLQFNAATGAPEPSNFTSTQLANAVAASYFSGNIAPLAWGVGFVNATIGIGGDDTAAIQAAIDSLPAGWTLALPPGTFRVTSLTLARAIKLLGAMKSNTILVPTSATLDTIVITTGSAVVLENFAFLPSVTRTAGAFVKVQPASSYNFDSVFRRLFMGNAFDGFNFVDAADFTVEDCYIVSYVRNGVHVANVNSPDSGDSLVFGNTFDGSGAGAGSGVAVHQISSGGLRVLGNKFLGGAYHYLGEFTGSTNTSILLFQDNSSEAAGTANVALNGTSPTTFGLVSIQNNEIAVFAGATGVLTADPGYDFLDVVTVGGNNFILDTGATAMVLGRGKRVSLLPNNIAANGASTTGVNFQVNLGTTSVHVQDIRGATTRYTGTMTNVTFVPGGLVQSGTSTSATTTSAYGALFAGPTTTVTFPTAYPKAPSVVTLKTTNIGGGVGALLVDGSITAAQFQYVAIGIGNTAAPKIQWEASGG